MYNHGKPSKRATHHARRRRLPSTQTKASVVGDSSSGARRSRNRVRIVRDRRRSLSADSAAARAVAPPSFLRLGLRGGTAALSNILAPLGNTTPSQDDKAVTFGVGVAPPPIPSPRHNPRKPLRDASSSAASGLLHGAASTPKRLPKLKKSIVANAIRRNQQFAQTAYMSPEARAQHLLATASGGEGAMTGGRAMPAAELSVAERLERMYAEVSESAHYTASDRIGRNYSASAAGLTMRNIRARRRMEAARGIQTSPSSVARNRRRQVIAPVSRLTHFPQATMSLMASASTPLLGPSSLSPAGGAGAFAGAGNRAGRVSPTTHDASPRSAFGAALVDEREIDLRPDANVAKPVTTDEVRHEVEQFWALAKQLTSINTIAPPRARWRASILKKLRSDALVQRLRAETGVGVESSSESEDSASDSGSPYGSESDDTESHESEQHPIESDNSHSSDDSDARHRRLLRREAAELKRQRRLRRARHQRRRERQKRRRARAADRRARQAIAEEKGSSIVAALQELMGEAERGYHRSVQRSVLEYHLLNSTKRQQLNVRQDVLAMAKPPRSVWHSRDTCNVSATRIARCRERIARRLFVPMLPLLQAKSLTRTPGTPFFEFSFISVTQSSYQATLPVQPDEFFNFLQSEVETSFKLLCDKWRRGIVRIAAVYMHEVGMGWGLAQFEKSAAQPTPQQREFKRFIGNLLRSRFDASSGSGDQHGSASTRHDVHGRPIADSGAHGDAGEDEPLWARNKPDPIALGKGRGAGGSAMGSYNQRKEKSLKLPQIPRQVYGMFRGLSVIMSLELRSIVYRSIDALLEFVEKGPQQLAGASGVKARASGLRSLLGSFMERETKQPAESDTDTDVVLTPAFEVQLDMLLDAEETEFMQDHGFTEMTPKHASREHGVKIVPRMAGRTRSTCFVSQEHVSSSDDVIEGGVSFVMSPSFPHIETMLLKMVDLIVLSGQRMRKVDAEFSSGEGVGPLVLDTTLLDPKSSIPCVDVHDARVLDARRRLRLILRSSRRAPSLLLERFAKFQFLFSAHELRRLQQFVAGTDHRLSAFDKELKRYAALKDEIENTARDIEVFDLVEVHTRQFKAQLCKQAQALSSIVLERVSKAMMDACLDMNKEFASMSQTLQQAPEDTKELVALSQYSVSSIAGMARLGLRFSGRNGVVPHLRLLQRWGHGVTISDTFTFKETLEWPDKIRKEMDHANSMLDLARHRMSTKLNKEIAVYRDGASRLFKLVASLRSEATLIPPKVSELRSRCHDLHALLNQALADAEAINLQQQQLGIEETDLKGPTYRAILELEPFERLWDTVDDYLGKYHQWYRSPLRTNDPTQADKDADMIRVAMMALEKDLAELSPAAAAIATKVKGEVQQFLRSDVLLLALLANPGLKERHWERMAEIVGYSLPHSATSSLNEMLQIGLNSHLEAIEEVCVQASKEYNLEKALARMHQEWEEVHLQLKPYKGTFLLRSSTTDEVQGLLDEHIVKGQTMQASRYAKALGKRIKEWVDSLNLIQDVLEAWLACQSTYLYLEPIFSSDDIMQQMPEEGVKFQTVHEMWCDVMRVARAAPAAFTAMRQQDLLDRLKEANQELETIMSGLNAYLETKRLYFPRFFFLSNEELLEILAETKDPHRVQKHLPKCFEGIARLAFDEHNDIRAMFSKQGERLDFMPLPKRDGGRFINPASAGSNVEVWLLLVEASMRAAVSRNIDQAMGTVQTTPDFIDWVRKWSQQAVLAVSEVLWTSQIAGAIRSGGPPALRVYAQSIGKQLQDIITLVRGVLTSLDRSTFTNLVVLAVHKRDVVHGMAKAGVDKETDFEWVAQLRYTWYGSKRTTRDHRPRPIELKMINASVGYACEYLGNSGRLVITPLTDRCYRTLMGAIHMNMGGAPEGPAGTGKTETSKDLAKAAGMMCVVFNCSDGLDHLAMAKFFKGLASCGAWACFDEFNRIELEVLSVIAQQILSIQRAKRARLERLTFEGTDIKLNADANIFITMNPGYAGRAELPDNLKALFRSVAMMVPDYSLIAEIVLYSNGYVRARDMARKIVATYKLCSEQLSSQDHYDYGMRAVIAVLRAASQLKQVERETPEDVLITRAIVDVNLPKFLSQDVPLFQGIVHDLFPHVDEAAAITTKPELVDAVELACRALELQPKPGFVHKIVQVFDTMCVRHGFMLIGEPWAGKTAAIRVLQRALQNLAPEFANHPFYRPLSLVVVNPKAVTIAKLYGHFDDVSHEWTDGVLPSKFRECVQDKVGSAEHRKWMVFDGPIDSLWIENMNTVLDDNKKLCLMSGEIIKMTDSMSMVFEAADLAEASPATVSRCGMVYMEPSLLGWQPIVQSWLDHHMDANPKYVRRFARATSFRTGRKSSLRRSSVAIVQETRNLVRSLTREPDTGARAGAGGDAGAGAGAGSVVKQSRVRRKSSTNGTVEVEVDIKLGDDHRGFIIDKEQRKWLQEMLDWLIPPCLVFLRQRAKHIVPVQDTTKVVALLNMLGVTIHQVTCCGDGGYKIRDLEFKGRKELGKLDFECLFVHALIWGFGGAIDNPSRREFGQFVRDITSNVNALGAHELFPLMQQEGYEVPPTARKLSVDLPKRGSVFDLVYAAGERRWKSLEDSIRHKPVRDPQASFSSIIVPTTVSVGFHHLANMLVRNDHCVMVVGPSGTGKSLYVSQLLRARLPERFSASTIHFSATTKASAVQAEVEGQMERLRRGVFGPRGGSTDSGRRHLVFVDDFNMPEVEQYGAQPPLELLRQLLDHRGWFDLSDNTFKVVMSTTLLAAMAPVGGGRNPTSSRTLRHFVALGLTDLADATLRCIYSTILTWSFSPTTSSVAGTAMRSPYTEEVEGAVPHIMDATVFLYNRVRASLLPTPTKSHYTFNLRDVAHVIEGVVMASPASVTTLNQLARLWVHEVSRVFVDRLNSAKDIVFCLRLIREAEHRTFGIPFSELVGCLADAASQDKEGEDMASPSGASITTPTIVPSSHSASGVRGGRSRSGEDPDFENMEYLLWGNYLKSKTKKAISSTAGAAAAVASMSSGPQQYRELGNYAEVVASFDAFKVEYNAYTKAPLDIVFFSFFVSHTSRIARLFAQPRGNALLVGVGGSGKRSAARFAAFISDFRVMQIELTKTYTFADWREDLKGILREAGTYHRPVVFILEDSQLRWEGMVEDVNNVLHSGCVPNLYAADERAEIVEKMRPVAASQGLPKSISDGELYKLFVRRMRSNVHLVLCMSPASESFRSRLRKYPALVSSCTIDWFFPWPTTALRAVGRTAISDLQLPTIHANSVVALATDFHRISRAQARVYRESFKRFAYVTPTSFMELFTLFRKTLTDQRKEVVSQQRRYEQGLAKLAFASEQVAVMQQELENLAPVLESSHEQTQELMAMCQERLPVVERTRKLVERDRNQATKEARAVQLSMKECEDDLSEALPVLNAAIRALNTLTSSDIKTVKSMLNPPAGVRLVMSAVCIMLGVPPDRVKDVEHPTKKIDDYWGPARRLLADFNFLDKLKRYDKDNVPPKAMAVIRKHFVPNPDFQPSKVKYSSSAAEGMCKWVRALEKYDKVARVVAPKKRAVEAAQRALDEKLVALQTKQDELDEVESELKQWQDQLRIAEEKKTSLEEQRDNCQKKLTRAVTLLNSLGGEGERWTNNVETKKFAYTCLTGDMLLASACMSYLGAFSREFRSQTLRMWEELLLASPLGCSLRRNPTAPPSSESEVSTTAAATPSDVAVQVASSSASKSPEVRFSLAATIGDGIKIQEWHLQGLPKGAHSVDNAVIVAHARRWPLMIDPQGQAKKWVMAMERTNHLQVVKPTDKHLLRTMENAVQYGQPVLLEDVGEELDSLLDPIFARKVFKQAGVPSIKMGDTILEYSLHFKLYITTRLRNPHFLPDTHSKLSVLNFGITGSGLEDQLLSAVVEHERPDLQEQKTRIMTEMARNKASQRSIEDRILHVLSSNEGNILDDEVAISALDESKAVAVRLEREASIARDTEVMIDQTREQYRSVASQVAALYFCIRDLEYIDPMYQHSMSWFMHLFKLSIGASESATEVVARIDNIVQHFRFYLYSNVCRSLFERDKLLFSFVLTVKVLQQRDEIDNSEWLFFLTGGAAGSSASTEADELDGADSSTGFPPNPTAEEGWLEDQYWLALCRLSQLPAFAGISQHLAEHPSMWRLYCETSGRWSGNEGLPSPWNASLSPFQRILVLRCILPNKVVQAVQAFVELTLGRSFLQPPHTSIEACFKDSAPVRPLIFILSSGSDPLSRLMEFADSQRQRVRTVSLGQGQGPAAAAVVKRARKSGSWVLLQNCHLAKSWMPTLAKIVEGLRPENTHTNFRLWLTSYPSPDFPVSVLQNGVKMTHEAPTGLRANLLRSYESYPLNDPEFLNDIKHRAVFHRVLFGLCFLHALVQERRWYGALGWNIPYEFTESDLHISVYQLVEFINSPDYTRSGSASPDIPFKTLRYLIGECNYGGRVTDDKDRRLLMTMVTRTLNQEALRPHHHMCELDDVWLSPPASAVHHKNYLSHIHTFPVEPPPEVFGLHSTAREFKDQTDFHTLLASVVKFERNASFSASSTQPSEGGGSPGGTRRSSAASTASSTAHGEATRRRQSVALVEESAVAALDSRTPQETAMLDKITGLEQQLRSNYDIAMVTLKHPLTDEKGGSNSLNSTLVQELARFNRLLDVIRTSLHQLRRAIKGEILMSGALEEQSRSLFFGQVPAAWMHRSYPSLKPLAAYVADLRQRLAMFDGWVSSGPPSVFWLSGFFFTQSFLTSVMQRYARARTIPIDELSFDFTMLPGVAEDYAHKEAPNDGAYVYGAYLHGCRWDVATQTLAEAVPRQLFSSAPIMWIKPCSTTDLPVHHHYDCPLYRTSERRGTLSTTGHSTNFVMFVTMPSKKEHTQAHWVERGVALVLSLDY